MNLLKKGGSLISPKFRIELSKKLGRIPVYRDAYDNTRSIFIHIPKAAGMSVVKCIYGLDSSNHYGYKDYKTNNIEKYNSYFKFSFVRNPYDRLISAYTYLSQGGMNEIDRYWYKKFLSQYGSLSSFIQNGGLEKAINENAEHFIPQHCFVYNDGKLEVDFLGKLESINDDMEYLSTILKFSHEFRKVNASKPEGYSLSEDDKKIVSELYSLDFELLGYEK